MVLICLSGFGAATLFISRENERVDGCRALLKFLMLTRDMVSSYSASASYILESCPRQLLESCGYPVEEGVPESFASMAERCRISDGETREIFLGFALDFGKCYRQEQADKCAVAIEAIRKRADTLARESPTRKKLIVGVSVAVTAMLVILLL